MVDWSDVEWSVDESTGDETKVDGVVTTVYNRLTDTTTVTDTGANTKTVTDSTGIKTYDISSGEELTRFEMANGIIEDYTAGFVDITYKNGYTA